MPHTPNKIDTGYNAKYSRFIKRMRFALPMVALIIGAVVFSWGFIDRNKLTPTQATNTDKPAPQSALIAPNFQSVDEKGRPFNITAKTATQDETNPDLVHLNTPAAAITLNDTREITLTARAGAYDQTNRALSLNDEIIIKTTDGYTLSGAQLGVNFKTGRAVSDEIITGTGHAGTLFAHGLIADTNTDTLTLIGPAKLTINQTSGGDLF